MNGGHDIDEILPSLGNGAFCRFLPSFTSPAYVTYVRWTYSSKRVRLHCLFQPGIPLSDMKCCRNEGARGRTMHEKQTRRATSFWFVPMSSVRITSPANVYVRARRDSRLGPSSYPMHNCAPKSLTCYRIYQPYGFTHCCGRPDDKAFLFYVIAVL